MWRSVALAYLLIGIALCLWVGLGITGITTPPPSLAVTALNLIAMPGALLNGFVHESESLMRLLVWGGSVLVNFGLLSWITDNLGK